MGQALSHPDDGRDAWQGERDREGRPHGVLREAHEPDPEDLPEHERRRPDRRDDDLDDAVVLLLEDAAHDVGAVHEDRDVDEEEERRRDREVHSDALPALAALDLLRLVRLEVHAQARRVVDLRVDALVLEPLLRRGAREVVRDLLAHDDLCLHALGAPLGEPRHERLGRQDDVGLDLLGLDVLIELPAYVGESLGRRVHLEEVELRRDLRVAALAHLVRDGLLVHFRRRLVVLLRLLGILVGRPGAVLGDERIEEAARQVDDGDAALRDEVLRERDLDEDHAEAERRDQERRDPERLPADLLEVFALDDGEQLPVHGYFSSSAVGA